MLIRQLLFKQYTGGANNERETYLKIGELNVFTDKRLLEDEELCC